MTHFDFKHGYLDVSGKLILDSGIKIAKSYSTLNQNLDWEEKWQIQEFLATHQR